MEPGQIPVSMPRRPTAGPALADITAPSCSANAGPAPKWKTTQLWAIVAGPAMATLHVTIIN